MDSSIKIKKFQKTLIKKDNKILKQFEFTTIFHQKKSIREKSGIWEVRPQNNKTMLKIKNSRINY